MMKRRKFVALIIVVALIPLSGCGDQGGQLAYNGPIEVQNGMFVMNGSVSGQYYSDPETYEDVAIHLYNDTGAVFQTVAIGEVTGSRNVSIRADTVPKYVVIDSPTVWDQMSSDLSIRYYEREMAADGGKITYEGHTVSKRDELPVELPES